eukprot:CAMPEP_0181312014 /NCGR_PEP_ID=MMETSP1101-20121128/13461_1 /TAXON_ID=46948 /ORGANISM="Rhodomonas abbreviata, Strain Caron Lab Isolate" /LENGTH=152 /DNA_ID=CAMNT_0023418817 /DNA_START=76 /DNA_END=534 /DNA_ORIENTATION=-
MAHVQSGILLLLLALLAVPSEAHQRQILQLARQAVQKQDLCRPDAAVRMVAAGLAGRHIRFNREQAVDLEEAVQCSRVEAVQSAAEDRKPRQLRRSISVTSGLDSNNAESEQYSAAHTAALDNMKYRVERCASELDQEYTRIQSTLFPHLDF